MATTFEITIPQGATQDVRFNLLQADGTDATISGTDVLRFRIYRRDGDAGALNINSSADTANDSGITVDTGASPPTATVRFAEDDIAALAPGSWRGLLYMDDDSESEPADAVKMFSEGVVNVIGGPASASTQPPQILPISEAIASLGLGSTLTLAQRGQLTSLHRRAERTIRRYLGFGVTQATYTHYLPRVDPWGVARDLVDGNRVLVLPERPVRSITNLYEDTAAKYGQQSGSFPASSELTIGEDFYSEEVLDGFNPHGRLIREVSTWYAEPGTIKVTYVAGWSAGELSGDVSDPTLDAGAIADAVLLTIHKEWSQQQREADGGAIKSERLADHSYTLDAMASGPTVHLTPQVKDMLARFRKVSI